MRRGIQASRRPGVQAMCGAVCVVVMGCGLDAIVFGEFTRGDQVEVPGAGVTEISGTAPGLSAAPVAFLSADGKVLDALGTAVDGFGAFKTSVPGDAGYTNLVVTATAAKGSGQAWGLVPDVPRQTDVFETPAPVSVGELGPDSTFATLLVLAKAKGELRVQSPSAVSQAQAEVLQKRAAGNVELNALEVMLQALRSNAAVPPLVPFPEPKQSYLSSAALGIDYTGDGVPDTSTAAFDAALAAALGAFEFHACYPPDRIRLVLIAELKEGGKNRNCLPIEPFKWAKDEPGKSLFVTGGIHKETPRCGDVEPPCFDDAQVDEASALLGNWTPNLIRMYDDGTNGDETPDDGLWTVALDLPWFDPGDGPGVRIGYKYTFGHSKQGWTDSEEWPGNQRILELRDVSGDHVIVRRDIFGDETTNKDKANGLLPSHGGCGTVVFPGQDSPSFCTNDSVEAQIDTDGDCVLDTWPAPGVSGPISVDCPK